MWLSSPWTRLAGSVWAVFMLILSFTLPAQRAWTIDDAVKLGAAEVGSGAWAEIISDGPVRSQFPDRGRFSALRPPFAQRVDNGLAVGFSPWTRLLFKAVRSGGKWAWRLFPAVAAVATWFAFELGGMPLAFLLLPLTFYGLVPWEHAVSWLLAWPSIGLIVGHDQRRPLALAVAGAALAVSAALRPEGLVLAAVLAGFLLWQRQWPQIAAFTTGIVICGATLIGWHELTATQSALVQIKLNLAGNPSAVWPWLTTRLYALYRLLISMDIYLVPSVLLFLLFAAGIWLVHRSQGTQKKTLPGLGLTLLALWLVIYLRRMWSHSLPMLDLVAANSLFACLPWTAVLFWPPYRGRTALFLAVAAAALVLVSAPVWEGVHWGPRVLLFILPLLLIDLQQTGRARGYLFAVLLVLTAVQTANSALLVYARSREISDRIEQTAPRLGPIVICRNQHQCADLAPLWKGREFFTAKDPRELKQLLIELRFAGVDTAWLHTESGFGLSKAAFPEDRPVRTVHTEPVEAGRLFKTTWDVSELALNRGDSLWAGILQNEAGLLMLDGSTREAIRLQREAVAVAPTSAPCHHNLALLLSQDGQYEEARIEAETALDLDPGLTEPRRLLELLATPPESAP
jgi:tetratricopeptide (TPR) repeat protein